MLLALLPHATPAAAGAWTQAEGDSLLITSLRYTAAGTRFDALGTRRNGADFIKREVTAYLEYGLRNALTLVLAPSFQSVGDAGRSEAGLAYTDAGLRLRLYQGRFGVISIQPLIVIPGTVAGSANPVLGSGVFEEEARVLAGSNFTLFGLTGFQNVEAAYRWRASRGDQLRGDVTVGLNLTARLQLLAQSFTLVGEDDVLQQKLQGSLAYALTGRWTVESGYMRTIQGRNVVAERGPFLALWVRF